MTAPAPRDESRETRRAANARKRISRRPSRLGSPAGATPKPDREREPGAGFTGLLERAWARARQAGGPRAAVGVLLTLDGHVPAEVQLRALGTAEEAAFKVLWGLTWRTGEPAADTAADGAADREADDEPVFTGELALARSGRVAVRAPSQPPLRQQDLVGGSLRVPWSARAVRAYRRELAAATARRADEVAHCRAWLAEQGEAGRDELLDLATEAALRTAPFVLYQEEKQYTNFRDQNNITGKTLFPGHPDCALSSLRGLPLDLWSDHDVQLLVCLVLLIRSAGPGRVEEANGTQLSLDHVAAMLERVRRGYAAAPGGPSLPHAAAPDVAALDTLATTLGTVRKAFPGRVQLYREIHGALMHKIERVAAPPAARAHRYEQDVCARLSERLPLTGGTFDALADAAAAAPGWLARPHGAFGSGLESLVYETVAASADVFRTDFAMSRGMRSLPTLVAKLRAESWAEICGWDITKYFCCVVPAPEARRHFGDSATAMADAAWAMSSRMQYNSWHFIAGNLPRTEEVLARDHFVPPTIPDVAFFSDQHHHGHVTNKVRFSIRSPQAVEVAGRRFNGFVDLRLLRCDGTPFDEQDLLAAHRVSGLVGRVTGLAAELAAAGEPVEVTAFDAGWHRAAIAGAPAAARTAGAAGRATGRS
ncbi:hypothetical protein DMB38_31975 [Streptomyces sp. WAC 06738]|uniref:hypothetical protein n=1 Tax=Streptomyces sp. WAC 06738 TaxID=2203210 RepID=UPI000F6FCA28|nr:hypothetical protein [Streptomyces sp. WAC 06738]AZM49787.1 hypothetical protein DMB38_31975 [Streptomyces sp. WAC 06738]